MNDFKNELPKKQSYTVTKEMPKTDHIILEKLTFKNIMKFFGDIAQYQEKHGISLPATTMTSTRVRTKIMAKNTDITDHEEFFGMSTHILMRKIQKTIRPEDALAFAEMMTTGVDFWLPDNFKLSFLNFGVFYESILIYKRDFWDAFKYLSFHNAENIPRIDNKPGGMIKIFLQKIPFDYGEKLFRTFKSTTFSSVGEFIDCFLESAKEHYDIHKHIKLLSHYIPNSGMSSTNSKAAANISNNRQLYHISNTKRHLDQCGEFRDVPNNPEMEGHEDEDFCNEDADIEAEDGYTTEHLSFVPNTDTKPLLKQQACFKLLFNGECKDAKCQFSHTPGILESARLECIEKLQRQSFKRPATNDTRNSKPSRTSPWDPN